MATSPLTGSIIFMIFGIIILFITFNLFKQKRLIENIPTSKIRSMSMGLVELNGVASVYKSIIKSPLTNNDCIYYNYKIEQLQSSGKNSRWVTLKSGSSEDLFILKDDTGKVLIDPKFAIVEIPHHYQTTSKLGVDPEENIKSFLESEKINFEGFLGINKTMKYTETIISQNDSLYVMGTAQTTQVENKEQIVIKIGANEPIYFISDKSEKEIIKSKNKNILITLSFGGVFFIIGLAMLLNLII